MRFNPSILFTACMAFIPDERYEQDCRISCVEESRDGRNPGIGGSGFLGCFFKKKISQKKAFFLYLVSFLFYAVIGFCGFILFV